MKDTKMKKFTHIETKEVKHRKIKLTPEEIQKRNASIKRAFKIVFYSGMTALIIAGGVIVAGKTIQFFRENTILTHSPVEVRFYKPLEIVSLSELYRREQNEQVMAEIQKRVTEEYLNPKPAVVCEPKVENIDPKAFFASVRMKESTNGTNTNPKALHNYCKAKGMWNEIGYSPSTKFCFKDQQEAELYVAYYVKKNCDGKTQAMCECYWNKGTWENSCAYSEGDLSLAN